MTGSRYKCFRSLLAALLICCMVFAAGCAGTTTEPATTAGPAATVPQTTKEQKPTETVPPTTESSAGYASLNSLRQTMVETPQLFAVAGFGFHNTIDSDLPVDPFEVMRSLAPGLCDDLPFLLEIPEGRIIGKEGELYCIVPLDTDARVTVSQGAWSESRQEYIYDNSIFTSESGEPILLFCNTAGWEPDTKVQISGPSGDVTWYPQLDDNRCAMPLLDDNWEKLFSDFSPYRELLAANYASMKENMDWDGVLPTKEVLIGKAWAWSGFLKDGREASYRVWFEEDYLSVRWNDGIEATDYELPNVPWKLTYDEGFAVLTIDFGGFAGVHRYNLMYSQLYDFLYVGMDVLQEDMPIGWEPLYRFLQKPVAPDPAEMIGIWELAWTEVEGDRCEVDPDQEIIVITGGSSQNSFGITLTNMLFPEESFQSKALTVSEGEMYPGCGNSAWVANVDHTGPYNTTYAVTLLEDDTLMLQNYWLMDGAPMVSYKWYRRIS